ncbi:MAG: 2-oxoglutarate ferredoxin oxidoreductase subunit alpha [Nitrospirae bacterium]|nr:2-oxoglutarate ferredoxin oxidoreductase subunit alpha [Nitrospirota bacterium]
MKRLLATGNEAITEGAILAGCKVFVGYPITPATEIAEAMSRRLPQVGGFYLQGEDETAAMHICIGASLAGLKAMTATSGPGFILYMDPYGWAISSEIPVVVLNAQRVGPVSGITGAPGQGEFYLSRYITQGGNFETIVLAPNSVQEVFSLTVEAFYLAERFRTPVTILADQLICDGWEDLTLPESEEEMARMGLRVLPRRVKEGPIFYPDTDEIDIPPVVLGRGTGAAVSDWTPTAEGYDIEDMRAHHQHVYRLVYKIRNHRELITRHEAFFLEDDPEIIVVSFGSPSRVVRTAVTKARAEGLSVGAIRLVSLWPFPDELFRASATYLSVELNYDGQLVREVQRAAPKDSEVHFLGKCGELPKVSELLEAFRTLAGGKALARIGWELEAW